MKLISKAAYSLSGLLFLLLLLHARTPEILSLQLESERTLLFLTAVSAAWGFLLSREDPLPYMISRFWFISCVYTFLAITDSSLGLGNLEGGMFSFWPLHFFTAYGGWLIVTREEVEQEQVRRLWAVGIAAFLMSPLFNYG